MENDIYKAAADDRMYTIDQMVQAVESARSLEEARQRVLHLNKILGLTEIIRNGSASIRMVA
jgi:hypothetical protein